MLLQHNDLVLFYGDSITDAGRREPNGNHDGLGWGYPALLASLLPSQYPDWNLRFLNAGISGDRLVDLEQRLDADVLAHRPTVVSILIGINDTWRRYDRDMISPVEEFADRYNRLLGRIRYELTARVVVCEPFLLPVLEDRIRWREDLDPRIAAVRAVARDHQAVYVPLDGIFAAAACRAPMTTWAADGVHPTHAGHGLIADAWLRAVSRQPGSSVSRPERNEG